MKDIKDYIHLYIGCEVQWSYNKKIGRLTGKHEVFGWQIFDPSNPMVPYHFVREELITLILRRLSSMKADELREFFNEPNLVDDYCTDKIYKISGSVFGLYNGISQHGSHDSIPWLLSRGFDLFNLIDSGLAIDKDTLK